MPRLVIAMVVATIVGGGCVGPSGKDGSQGPEGPTGPEEPQGPAGSAGNNGGNATGTQAPQTWTSGTRIKARTTTTTMSSADGFQLSVTTFGGYFDSTRNEPCAPTPASDGITRCLPAATYAAASGPFYADAACTIVVAPVTGCNPPAPKYIAISPAATCPASTMGTQIFAAGTGQSSYYYKPAATCTGPTTLAGYTFYPISGSEISPSSFAAMTVTTTTQ
jgi:hypothetical protein